MAAGKLLFCILCTAFIGSSGMPDGNMLKKDVVAIAAGELGVREATGHNDGTRVEAYLRSVNLKKGAPYCAAFVSWVFMKAGYPAPRTAWSPDLFPASRCVAAGLPGEVFGIYFQDLKRIAHCGIVVQVRHDWVYTIEANTDASGGREGEGVYRRMRHKKGIRKFANWTGGSG